MSNNRPLILILLLYPFSFLYGLGTRFRNWLFDVGILKAKSFDVPIVCVGNITVGGTGKTPMTEYLISLLCSENKVGVLSRGYKRKTSGFVLATDKSSSSEIGDEPCQMKRKFPKTIVAVDADRCRGINKMLNFDKKPNVILLDDAFQHRYVKAGVYLLLIDYNRLITEDYLLPLGRLREPVSAKNRANIVVVNKCPDDIKPMEFRIIRKKLKLYPYQTLFFTTISYGELIPLFTSNSKPVVNIEKLKIENYSVLCLTGIANPKPFEDYLSNFVNIEKLNFSDHHDFSKNDMQKIEEKFNSLDSKNKVIITTEKDAMRLFDNPEFPEKLKQFIYYIPLQLKFMDEGNKKFDNLILDYVKKNTRSL